MRTIASLLLVLLGTSGPLTAQDDGLERSRLRRQVTRWLRARQSVLLTCPRCAGTGSINVPGLTARGLESRRRVHRVCRGTGKNLRSRALRELNDSYLPGATAFPGLGRPRVGEDEPELLPPGLLSETQVREFLDDVEVDPRVRLRWLRSALGVIRGSARVERIELEREDGEVRAANVRTTADPRRTRWVLRQDRWYVVSPEPLENGG